MTKEHIIECLTEAGFKPEDKGETLSVPIGTDTPQRFRFPWKKLDPEAEGLARDAHDFAQDLDENMLYAIKISELTDMSPKEVSELPPEDFQRLVEKDVIRKARMEVRDIMDSARKLADVTDKLFQSLSSSED